jgi:hypothetical protein
MKKKDEGYFQKKFLEFYKEHPFFEGSFMTRETPQFYSFEETKRIKDNYMPFSITDFIELDRNGFFHLWEAKMLNSDELLKGKAIGQLLFYDFLFKTYPEEDLKALLIDEGFDKNIITKMTYDDFNFKTWNILVCGGEGWELCAGVNPIMWNYPTLPEQYFKESVPKLNLFHFYEVTEGYDLKNIWELAIDFPQKLHKEAFIKYLELSEVPNDDDIQGVYLDFFNMQCELTNDQIEILIDYNEASNQSDFLEKRNLKLSEIEEINSKFQDSLQRLMIDENKELEAKEHFNRFIGRDWFKINNSL